MQKVIIIIVLLVLSCKNTNKETSPNSQVIENIKITSDSSSFNNRKLERDSFKLNKEIDWHLIPLRKLPISSISIANDSLKYYLNKKNKNHLLNILYSNKTEFKSIRVLDSVGVNTFDGHIIHPNNTKGIFYCRLPNLNNNRVILFSYLDMGYDYKGMTYEIQIFDTKNEIIDKLILQDEINYECGWTRTFSILKDYTLKIKDYSYCVDFVEENGERFDEIEVDYLYKIVPTGKIKKIREKIIRPLNVIKK